MFPGLSSMNQKRRRHSLSRQFPEQEFQGSLKSTLAVKNFKSHGKSIISRKKTTEERETETGSKLIQGSLWSSCLLLRWSSFLVVHLDVHLSSLICNQEEGIMREHSSQSEAWSQNYSSLPFDCSHRLSLYFLISFSRCYFDLISCLFFFL